MSDGELDDDFGLPEYFVDGFTNYALIDGILRCTGFEKVQSRQGLRLVPRFKLQITPAGAIEARAKAFDALQEIAKFPETTVTMLRRVN